MKSFVTRKQLAALLGLKVGTLGRWDRTPGREIGKPVYLSQTCVAYTRADAEAFLERIGIAAHSFLSPAERGARPQRRPDERSGVLKAPTTPTPDDCGRKEDSPVLAAEREGRES